MLNLHGGASHQWGDRHVKQVFVVKDQDPGGAEDYRGVEVRLPFGRTDADREVRESFAICECDGCLRDEKFRMPDCTGIHVNNARLFDKLTIGWFLRPLIDANVDILDCWQRRFWEPEFEGSDLNLAGWVKKISDMVTMAVGSVGLDLDLIPTLMGETGNPAGIDRLLAMLYRNEFDLVGVGRALLVDPQWGQKMQRHAYQELMPFSAAALATLS